MPVIQIKESPGSRALDFLPKGQNKALIPVLKKWAETGDKSILSQISYHVAAYGSAELLPELVKLLEHPEKHVARLARLGALFALRESRADAAFKEYVWKNCMALLRSPSPPQEHEFISILAAVNPEETAKLLNSPEFLRTDHPLLMQILPTLNELKAPIPADFLVELLSAKVGESEYRQGQIRSAALDGLVRQQVPQAAGIVEDILKNPDKHKESLVFSAWPARFKLKGIVHLGEAAGHGYEAVKYKFENLPEKFRGMILVNSLDSEIRNGGLDQWYFNSYGCHAEETLKTLEEIGAVRHASIIAKANSQFGKSGPAKERDKVQAQLERLSEKSSELLSALSDQWYKLPSVQLTMYEWDWKRQTGGE